MVLCQKTSQGLECEYDIREIDEDLYLAALQATKASS